MQCGHLQAECAQETKAGAVTLHANAEAELDTEEVEHLGEQNMRTELMERCVQKSGNLTAGGFFLTACGASAMLACGSTCLCLRCRLPYTDCKRAENACPFGRHMA